MPRGPEVSKEDCMEREEPNMGERAAKKCMASALIICSSLLLSGCVLLEEKYNAEKTRNLNIQRKKEQEKRRTAQLNSEHKRKKYEFPEYEARNR